MKKMIPVYLLQIAMLGAVLFVGLRLLNEVRAMRSDVIKMQTTSDKRPARSEPAINVRVVNPVIVTQ